MTNICLIIINYLCFLGINIIFGVPGSNAEFLKYIHTTRMIRFIYNKEEKNSVYMAMGYTKSSNKISCCFGSVGAGTFNLIPGVISAYYESTPILIIGSQSDFKNKGKNIFQESTGEARTISQIGQFKNIVKYSAILNTRKLYAQFKNIYFNLNSFRPGPVYLELPANILSKDVKFDQKLFKKIVFEFNKHKQKQVNKYMLNNNKISLLSRDLERSKSPIFLVGDGLKSDVFVKKISEKLNIPIVSTFKGKDKINNNFKYYIGVLGLIGTQITNDLFLKSDLIISIGTSLSQHTTDNWTLIKNKKIYRLDTITNDLTNHKAIVIKGNTDNILKELLDKLTSLKKYDEDSLKQLKQNCDIELKKLNTSLKLKIAATLKSIIPKNSIIVSEDILLVGKYFNFNYPNTNINYTNLAPIGCGISGAIGAKLANPNKPVFVILGDGGFNMQVSELNTILNYNLNIIILLFNNSAYGTVYKYQKHKYNMIFYSTYQNPNYCKLAQLFGIATYKINKNNINQLKKINHTKKSILFNIVINKDEKINCKIY